MWQSPAGRDRRRTVGVLATGAPRRGIRLARPEENVVSVCGHAVRGSELAGVALVALAVATLACSRSPATRSPAPNAPVYAESAGPLRPEPLHFAVHPLHNPAALARAYQPLVDHLNARLPGRRFVLEASRDYADYERKIRARGPELLLPNPWQALQAMKVDYRIIAAAGEPGDFRGLFLVRRDSPIHTVADLRGRSVAYPASTALAACIMPQWYLHEHGIDPNRDIANVYVGSQESAIMNAYLGRVAVGVTWPPPWRQFLREHPDEAARMRVLWETPPLVNNAIMVRGDLPPALADSLRSILVTLDRSEAGRSVLTAMESSRILPATAADYEPVRRFIARFEAEVRPVEGR